MINKPYFITEQEEQLSSEEMSQYIKKNLDMTESPIGGNYTEDQIDKMLYLIKNDWKESGWHWYEWIQTVYYDMKKINREQKEKYFINIDSVSEFRKELIKMIEQVRYNIGEYKDISSTKVAEKFEKKINSRNDH